MSDINKIRVDDTPYDVKDAKSVHYGEQSKGYVGKNLLKNNASTTEISGVTFTVNSDGSVTLNGTATANITSFFINSNMALKAGSYWLTGNPSGITGISYGLRIANTSYSVNTFFEQGKILTLNQDYSDLRIDIRIPNGQVIDNLTFYPMIRLSSIPDNTYEPYLTPNTDLMSYADNVVLGAKNLLPNNADNTGTSGVSYTINSDGSISTSGTANATIQKFIGRFKAKQGQSYTISSGNSDDNANCRLWTLKTDWSDSLAFPYGNRLGTDTEANKTRTAKVDEECLVILQIGNGTNVSGKTFYPMVRHSFDRDGTFAQFTMTNRELTENVLKTFYVLKTLSNADDLNDYTETGVYFIGGTAPAHAPEGKVNCILEVINCDNGELIIQRYTRPYDGFIYTRFKNPSNWFNWHKFTSTELT